MLALAAGGGAAAAPAQPWEPPAGARWQYQLESSAKSLKSTGGIDVNICQPPAGGGPCVRPQVFDIDLYQDGRISGNDHTVNTDAVNAIHRQGPQSASGPTTTSTSSSTARTATACWASRSATASHTNTGSTSTTTAASA